MQTAKIGSAAGFVCLIHCLAMPLLVSVLPLVGLSFLLNTWAELGLMATAVIFCVLSMCWGIKRHNNWLPFCVFCSGIAWFYLGHITHHHTLFIVVGGIAFAISNYWNSKLCKTCSHGCKH